MNKLTVTKKTKIVLDGKLYLLEEGDEIIVESLRESDKIKLANKLGITEITSVEDFWKSKEKIERSLKKRIGELRRMAEKQPSTKDEVDKGIKDIKIFLNTVNDFLRSFANKEVNDEINDDLIKRHEMTDEQLEAAKIKGDIEDTLRSHRAQEKEKLKRAFGETPEEATKRMRQEREKESKLFESVYNLLSI